MFNPKAILLSPYPWHYTLRWPFYFYFPSKKNHSKLTKVADISPPLRLKNKIRLVFCGDIMAQHGDLMPKLSKELCKLINSADFIVANLEGVLAEKPCSSSSIYRFVYHIPKDYLAGIMKQCKLKPEQWILSVANNHSGDAGLKNYSKSLKILQKMSIKTVGNFSFKENPLQIIENAGLRIGFFAWTAWMNQEVFSKKKPGVFRQQHLAQIDFLRLKQDLGLDFLVGLPHWGYEFQHFPYAEDRKLAADLINDNGFDFLVGAHTHTLQPLEIFQKGLCFYNLGNFCGFGHSASIRLIPILTLELGPENKTKNFSYKLDYFFQAKDANGSKIVPLDQCPSHIQAKVEALLTQLFVFKPSQKYSS